MTSFKIAIIGAGLAGLAAARELKKTGQEAVIFEKSNHPGGRVSTLKVGDYIFDTGATSIAPRGRSLEKVMLQELSQEGLVKVEKLIYVHSFGRIRPGEISRLTIERYVYQNGNADLATRLAEGLDIRYETHVGHIEQKEEQYQIQGELFDGLILTPPIPQTKELLETLHEIRPLSNSRYRACLSLMLGYDHELGDLPFHAVIDPGHQHPLTWLSLESLKAPGRAPQGHSALIAQMSPYFSHAYYDHEEDHIIEEALGYLEHLFGPKMRYPTLSQVKRWRFSQPETTALFESVNKPGYRVMVASDGVVGGRVEMAYEAGELAARQLIQTLHTA